MKNTISTLSFMVLALNASNVLAQSNAPVPSIKNATLNAYRSEYPQSALCSKEEITLWRCETGKREFALCSSPAATRTTGHLQYRTSHAGKPTFAYPEPEKPPLESFKYDIVANGDAAVEFINNKYRYNLVDPLRGRSAILVTAPGASAKTTQIACGANQTLQLNATMQLMHDFGLWDARR